jgi:hypothetical protein
MTIGYAAASPFHSMLPGILDRPVKPGDDMSERLEKQSAPPTSIVTRCESRGKLP